MNKDIDKTLSVINNGKMAEIAYQHFHSYVEAQKADVLSSLKNSYRNGNNDSVLLASGIACLCMLDDLENKIVKKIKQGRTENKGVFDADQGSGPEAG